VAKKDYGEEVKAAVLAALLVGQSVTSVAKEYNIPRGTISSWQKREKATLDTLRAEAAQTIQGIQSESSIGGKLAYYMEKSLDSLISQVEVMGEKDFLREQDMQQVAVGHGIQMDKFIRLLEAMNRDQPESKPTEN
jgi:transposase-like protein